MSFAKGFGTALVVSLLGSLLMLFIFRPFVMDPAMPLYVLSVVPVAILTTVSVLAATLLYALMRYFLSRPNKTFFWFSAVALMLSFFLDFRRIGDVAGPFAGTTVPSALVLMLMHTFATIVIVWSLMNLWGPRKTRVARVKRSAPPSKIKIAKKNNQMRF